jgi:alkaline phosphatase D
MKYIVTLLLVISFTTITYSQQRKLTAGPMPGHITTSTVKIWLLVKNTKNISLTLTNKNNPQNKKAIQVSVDTLKPYKKLYPIIVSFSNLNSDTEYELTLLLDKTIINKKEIIKTLKETPVADFSFLTGSCAMQISSVFKPFLHSGSDRMFKTMSKIPSDFMIWLGDNTYYIKHAFSPADFASAKGMWNRQIQSRKIKRMNTFLTSRPQYAIWDDHDYGSYDGDKSFPLKDTSLCIYKSLWANPSYGLPKAKGIFTSFRRYDSEFILLDDRFYRTERDIPNGTMLGKEQLNWFFETLKNSDAVFKFVILGSQMLNLYSKDECYNEYPEERKAILDYIKSNKITGVIFITGDSHYADLQKEEQTNSYPIYDFTSSPLTSFLSSPSQGNKTNVARVPNTLTKRHNVGKVSVTGVKGNRVCTIELYDDGAKLLWTHKIPEQELR